MIKFNYAKYGKYPAGGVYYALPSKGCAGWLLYKVTERNVDTGGDFVPDSEISHAMQYLAVVEYFNETFNTDISDIDKTCLPRGRVSPVDKNGKKVWLILHGGDTPQRLRHQIISEFGLEGNPNVVWEEDTFEQMNPGAKQRLIDRIPALEGLYAKGY
jgi:hypothetical protein